MKTIRLFLYMLFTMFVTACDNDEIHFTKGDIPRDVAYQLALKELDVSLKDVDIWATKEKLSANTKMEIYHFELTSPSTESWLFFIDEMPMGNWGHNCRYAFVDMNGIVQIHQKTAPPNYEQYNMELINISEARKNYNAYPIIPKVENKSRSLNPLENHYAIILSGGGVQS